MKRWTRPKYYMGEEYYEYYVLYSVTRDSDILTRSNWECILEEIPESETVIIQRSNHFLCGWVDLLLIHESDQEAIDKGNEILKAEREYPVLNDDHFSQLEFEETTEIWQDCLALKEKIQLCAEAGVSIFAARSEGIPEGIHGYINLY